MQLTNRQVTWSLVTLTLAALALTFSMAASDHHMAPIHYAPAVVMLAILVAWPFANGWRPWRSNRMLECAACGTLWHPIDEGTTSCPACGGPPT